MLTLQMVHDILLFRLDVPWRIEEFQAVTCLDRWLEESNLEESRALPSDHHQADKFCLGWYQSPALLNCLRAICCHEEHAFSV